MANFITIVVAICLFICQPTIVIDLGVLLSVLEKEKYYYFYLCFPRCYVILRALYNCTCTVLHTTTIEHSNFVNELITRWIFFLRKWTQTTSYLSSFLFFFLHTNRFNRSLIKNTSIHFKERRLTTRLPNSNNPCNWINNRIKMMQAEETNRTGENNEQMEGDMEEEAVRCYNIIRPFLLLYESFVSFSCHVVSIRFGVC